jgi:hypothetical protein
MGSATPLLGFFLSTRVNGALVCLFVEFDSMNVSGDLIITEELEGACINKTERKVGKERKYSSKKLDVKV